MDIHENVSLAEFTTLRLGGAARFFVSVHTVEELRDAVAYAREHTLSVFVLGGGSNVLFSEKGWDGLVIRIAITGIDFEEDSKGDARVTAGAGEQWDALVERTVTHGFWGMENLSYVPGTVGASPVQNIGCYGVSVSDIIDWVEVFDTATNALHILSTRDCVFGYRDSVFKHPEGRNYVVTRVAYRLSTHSDPKISYADLATHFEGRSDVRVGEVRDALFEIRGTKFPDLTEVGTAGSFFKNPVVSLEQLADIEGWLKEKIPNYPVDDTSVKIPLAWLLERFGWKGRRCGAVGCWKDQPLVLVHYGGATADDLIMLAYDIMSDVKKRTALRIEPEVCVVGDKYLVQKNC